MNAHDSDATMAVFLDLENIALGARDAHYPRFDIQKLLERLLLKGQIVVKKAYCDFDRYKEFKRDLDIWSSQADLTARIGWQDCVATHKNQMYVPRIYALACRPRKSTCAVLEPFNRDLHLQNP